MEYTIVSIVYLALFLSNRFLWHSPVFGILLALALLAYFGAQLGKRFLPAVSRFVQTGIGSFLLLSCLAVAGTILFYVAYVPKEVWIVFVLLIPPLMFLVRAHHDLLHDLKRLIAFSHRPSTHTIVAFALCIILIVVGFFTLAQTEIWDAVRTPWDRVPHVFFLVVALLAALISPLLLRAREESILLPIFSATFFLTIAVALLSYPLGYGFDPFLHQATESHIANFGTIDPKPFYYIGEYSLVLFFSQGFEIPIPQVDAWLVPLLSALLLPAAWLFGATAIENKKAALFSLLGLFLVPMTSWILTTPQNLANLFTLLLLLVSLPTLTKHHTLSPLLLGLLTLAVLAIHPLAGIPALLWFLLVCFKIDTLPRIITDHKKIAYAILLGGSVVALPLVFLVHALVSGLPIRFDLSALSPVQLLTSAHLPAFFKSGFDPILDFVYLIAVPTFVFAILGSFLFLWRTKVPSALKPYGVFAILLTANYIILSASVEFSFLIEYERSNYASRLLPLIAFTLAPFLLFSLGRLRDVLSSAGYVPRLCVVALLAVLIPAQVYLTYPRRDNYETSHGFNTSESDLRASSYIEEDGKERDYIVLANQQVSAGAVSQFGFKRYYHGDMFYYPIPTGGPLYPFFLTMNDSPSRETIKEAMQLAGVTRAYYVVNDYWWQAPRIIETAKSNADDWISIDEGNVYVFRYDAAGL